MSRAQWSTCVKGLIDRGYLLSDTNIAAMQAVDRKDFVRQSDLAHAMDDTPCCIGYDQTISAPHMIAIMLELADIQVGHRILEIGTGSGYNAAVMAHCCGINGHIDTVERISSLYLQAQDRLKHYDQIDCHHHDGHKPIDHNMSYDLIVVTCASNAIDAYMIDSLKVNGQLIIPLAQNKAQHLISIKKQDRCITMRTHHAVKFVPMIKNLSDL